MGTDHSTMEAVDRQTVAAAVAFPSAWFHRSGHGPWSQAEAWPSLLRRHTKDKPGRRAAGGPERVGRRHVTDEAAQHAGRDRRMAGVAAAAAARVGRRDGADSWGRGRGRAGCSRPCFGRGGLKGERVGVVGS